MVNFSQLYDKHVDSLFSFGSKFTSDRELIKDCIQDVFVKLFNKKETLDKVCNIESYLYVSLRNRINDEFRRQVRLSDEEITDYNTRRLAEQNNSYDFEKMEEEKREKENGEQCWNSAILLLKAINFFLNDINFISYMFPVSFQQIRNPLANQCQPLQSCLLVPYKA